MIITRINDTSEFFEVNVTQNDGTGAEMVRFLTRPPELEQSKYAIDSVEKTFGEPVENRSYNEAPPPKGGKTPRPDRRIRR